MVFYNILKAKICGRKGVAAVFQRCHFIVCRLRCIVDRRDFQRQGRGVGGDAVGDGVSHRRHGAIPVGLWRKAVAAIGLNGQLAHACDRRGVAHCVRLAFHLEVGHTHRAVHAAGAIQHVAGNGFVFSALSTLIFIGKAVGHRCDFQRQGRGVGGDAIGDGVGHGRHGAIPIGHWREAECTILRDGQLAHAGHIHGAAHGVRATIHLEIDHTHRAVHAAGAIQHVATDHFVFTTHGTLVGIGKTIGHRRDLNRQSRNVGADAIGDGVSHRWYFAVPVGHGGKAVRAIGRNGQIAHAGHIHGAARSVRATVDLEVDHTHRAVHAAGAFEHAAGNDFVFTAYGTLVGIGKAIGHGRDFQRQGRGVVGDAIGDGVSHGRHFAVPVGHGGKAECTIWRDGQLAHAGHIHGAARGVRATVDLEVDHTHRAVHAAGAIQHIAADDFIFTAHKTLIGIGKAIGHRGDFDGQCGVIGVRAIGDRVDHGWHRAIPVRCRGKAVVTIALNGQLANAVQAHGGVGGVGSVAHHKLRHCHRIGTLCIGQHIACDRLVFQDADAFVVVQQATQRHSSQCHATGQLVVCQARCIAAIGQGQGVNRLHHAVVSGDVAATAFTTGQGGRSGFQLSQWVLAFIQSGNHVLQLGQRLRCHGRFLRGHVFHDVGTQGDALAGTHSEGGLALRQQLDRCTGARDDVGAHRHLHTGGQGNKLAFSITNPCVASQLCYTCGSRHGCLFGAPRRGLGLNSSDFSK